MPSHRHAYHCSREWVGSTCPCDRSPRRWLLPGSLCVVDTLLANEVESADFPRSILEAWQGSGARAVLRRPGCETDTYKDVEKYVPTAVEAAKITCLTAGFPCQAFRRNFA